MVFVSALLPEVDLNKISGYSPDFIGGEKRVQSLTKIVSGCCLNHLVPWLIRKWLIFTNMLRH